MTTGVDEQFGRILAALEEQGLDQDTIVLFTSDHGNCLGAHELISKNNPFEPSMRVPFLIRWPGRIPARRDDLLLSSPDIYPTLLDLMGLGDAIPAAVEGVSHAGLFRGQDGPRPDAQLYLRVPCDRPAAGQRGVRTHQHTYVVERAGGREVPTMLSDRSADPHQLTNLIGREPQLETRLRERLNDWLARTGDPWLTVG